LSHLATGLQRKMAVAEGLDPSIVALTVRCLTNLATPQENFSPARREDMRARMKRKLLTRCFPSFIFALMSLLCGEQGMRCFQKIGCGNRNRTCLVSRLMRPPSPPGLFPANEILAAAMGVEPTSSRLQDERSVYRLSYAAREMLVDRERFELSSNSLQDCRSAIKLPARKFS